VLCLSCLVCHSLYFIYIYIHIYIYNASDDEKARRPHIILSLISLRMTGYIHDSLPCLGWLDEKMKILYSHIVKGLISVLQIFIIES